MDDDYKRFCLRCGWNDPDFGCVSPMHEAVWQCDMYRFYHPEELKQAEKEMEDFLKNGCLQNGGDVDLPHTTNMR